MTTEIRPFWPSGWPTDGRSICKNGILSHPNRDPMIFKNGKWEPHVVPKQEERA